MQFSIKVTCGFMLELNRSVRIMQNFICIFLSPNAQTSGGRLDDFISVNWLKSIMRILFTSKQDLKLIVNFNKIHFSNKKFSKPTFCKSE